LPLAVLIATDVGVAVREDQNLPLAEDLFNSAHGGEDEVGVVRFVALGVGVSREGLGEGGPSRGPELPERSLDVLLEICHAFQLPTPGDARATPRGAAAAVRSNAQRGRGDSVVFGPVAVGDAAGEAVANLVEEEAGLAVQRAVLDHLPQVVLGEALVEQLL